MVVAIWKLAIWWVILQKELLGQIPCTSKVKYLEAFAQISRATRPGAQYLQSQQLSQGCSRRELPLCPLPMLKIKMRRKSFPKTNLNADDKDKKKVISKNNLEDSQKTCIYGDQAATKTATESLCILRRNWNSLLWRCNKHHSVLIWWRSESKGWQWRRRSWWWNTYIPI